MLAVRVSIHGPVTSHPLKEHPHPSLLPITYTHDRKIWTEYSLSAFGGTVMGILGGLANTF